MGAFDTTIGVLLIGQFFNTYLYGLVTAQFLRYHNTEFNDPLWIRAVVGSLFAIDTAHSAIAVWAAWDLCVTNFANPAILAVVGWAIPMTAVLTAVVALISQFFLGYRIYRLTNSLPLLLAIGVLSLAGNIAGVVAGIQSWLIWDVINFGKLTSVVSCWLGFNVACDMAITAALTFALSRSRTGFARTDSILNRLIRGAVQTGVFASAFALGDLFSFVLHRDTYLYAMFAYPIGRIYTNTLLDTLNSRQTLKDKMGSGVQEADSALRDRFRTNGTQDNIHMRKIEVQTEVHTMHDTASRDDKYNVDGEVFAAPRSQSRGGVV